MKWKSLRFILAGAFTLLYAINLSAGEALEDEYLYGLDLFKEARYEQSARLFQVVLDSPDSKDYHGSASFWLMRNYFEMDDLDKASQLVEDFLLNYPNHELNQDARYYKGRILYLQGEYDKTIHFFSSFLTAYPSSPFYGNALFWIGESLYAMGRFDEAAEIYGNLLEQFPRSVKTEATRYRLSLIEYRNREEELLKLLQWSHEEFLKSSAEYEQKEKEFNQALDVYQQELIELTKTREVYENRLKLLRLKEEALILKEKLLSGEGHGDDE